jgi:PAS domain S-box-containing protein
MSASLSKIKKASSIVGVELAGKKWAIDDSVERRIRDRSITRFRALHELTDGVVSQKNIKLLANVFRIGETVVAKIAKDEVIMGYFVLLMSEGQTFEEEDLVEIYTQQVGLVLSRKKAKEQLRKSERKFRNYIENAPHSIFIMDENGTYLEVNKTACGLTGYSDEELIGMNKIDLIASESRNVADHSFEELKINGFTSAELLFVHKCDTVFWVRIDATRLSKTCYLVFATDITDKKIAEKSLIEAKIMAEENNRIKSEFLANMSHELRTPLTAIIGFSEILSNGMYGDLNEKQLKFSNNILKSGEHLLAIINNVLDLSIIEAGKMELECETFSLQEIFEEVRILTLSLAIRKNITLTLENKATSTEIFADRLKFKRIMYNLINNAIKFTPDNGRVSVFVKQTDNLIEVSISDTGIGIPKNKLEDIFDPFVQVDSSTKRRYGGTGLGLALVKRFVEMHEGKIWVESEEEKGSTFTFIIPRKNPFGEKEKR